MLPIPRCTARHLLVSALACWALPGLAQEHMTADEAVALALSQPHVRQELDAVVDIARSEIAAARTWPNPQVELSREQGNSASGSGERETTVLLSQAFELGGRRGLRADAARQGVHAAQVAAGHERARLRAEVWRAYSDVVAGERLGDAHARNARGLDDLAGMAANRFRAGDLSGYESRRIAQASAQAAAQAVRSEAAARAARARLAGWIGDVALSAQLDATPPLPELPVLPDDVRSAELDVLAARRAHARARAEAERRPALPIQVGAGSRRVEEGGLRDNLLIVELGVELPVFDRNQAERARTAAVADQADALYRRALVQTGSRRVAAFEEARHLSESARSLFETAVPEAARLTAIARASFAEGELDLVGLLDAHEAETDVVEQAIEQQSRALDALLELQQLTPLVPTTDPTN